jgi:transcriptional regulator with XRE-family HTH domain
MDIRRVFGANLRWRRLAAGLSQEALGVRMGVDRAHVSSMERGKQNVTLLTLWETAQAVGVRPAELLSEEALPRIGAKAKAPRSRRTPPDESPLDQA